MIIIVSKYLVPNGYEGFTVWPFVFLKCNESRANLVVLNHERIHLRQQAELLVLPFFIWYLLEFLLRYLKLRNWKSAYRFLSFEKEAYQNERDLNYLKHRKPFFFIRYLI
jgi:hypothetical protein